MWIYTRRGLVWIWRKDNTQSAKIYTCKGEVWIYTSRGLVWI